MKKLLFVSPVIPDYNGGGRNKRAHQWLHKLSEDYQVHLLVIDGEGQFKGGKLPDIDLPVASVRLLPAKSSRQGLWALIKGYLQLMVFNKDGAIGAWVIWLRLTDEDKVLLEKWYGKQLFDKLICFRIYLYNFALFIRQVAEVANLELDLDDLESETWNNLAGLFASNGKWVKAAKNWIQSRRFWMAEGKLFAVFHRIYVCSCEDQEKVARRCRQAQVVVFPNRMLKDRIEFRLGGNQFNILFVGTLGYYPNEDAVRWFVNEVMPNLLETGCPWNFSVVGYGASAKFSDWLSGKKGVTMLGSVKELGPVYSAASMVVAPLRAGGGTKLKVLEAMLYGCPVVATGEAVYGLDLVPDKHYLHASTPEDFARQCSQLAVDSPRWTDLVQNALAFIQQNYIY